MDKIQFRTKRQAWTYNFLNQHYNEFVVAKYVNSFKNKATTLSDRILIIRVKYRLNKGNDDKLASKVKNSVLKRRNKFYDVNDSHKPITKSSNWIGVEIECFIPKSNFDEQDEYTDCSNCEGSGELYNGDDEEGNPEYRTCLDCDGTGRVLDEDSGDNYLSQLKDYFSNHSVKFTQVKDDGSIDCDREYFTTEVTVLTKIDDFSNLKKVCNLLNKLGAKVNKSCGLHVHLDARHLTQLQARSIGWSFRKALPVLLNMVPKSRRGNTFCKAKIGPMTNKHDHRYYAVNMTAYKKFGSIEVRLHSGTTDFVKITNWIKLVYAISQSLVTKKCNDINELCDYINLDQEVMEYVAQRTALFSEVKNVTDVKTLDKDDQDQQTINNEIEQRLGA